MYFKSNDNSFSAQHFVAVEGGRIPGSAPLPLEGAKRIYQELFGEERPRDMWLLLGGLAISLHLLAAARMYFYPAAITPPQAKPLIMEIAMVSVAAPKPAAVQPPPPAPPPQKKQEIKKPVVKRTPPPIVQKSEEFAPPEPAPTPPQSQVAQSQADNSKSKEKTMAEQYTPASSRADYLNNPRPAYPYMAKSRGWTGKVLLRVRVSEDGAAESVDIERTSGHEVLDESAQDAVKKWRFAPAKLGGRVVACTVVVPVDFNLTTD